MKEKEEEKDRAKDVKPKLGISTTKPGAVSASGSGFAAEEMVETIIFDRKREVKKKETKNEKSKPAVRATKPGAVSAKGSASTKDAFVAEEMAETTIFDTNREMKEKRRGNGKRKLGVRAIKSGAVSVIGPGKTKGMFAAEEMTETTILDRNREMERDGEETEPKDKGGKNIKSKKDVPAINPGAFSVMEMEEYSFQKRTKGKYLPKDKSRVEFAAPFVEDDPRLVMGVIDNTTGGINVALGNPPERRDYTPGNLSSNKITNIAEDEFNNEGERNLIIRDDHLLTTPEIMTIANANLVKPEEEEARIIDNFVNTTVRASVVVEENVSLKKRIIYCFVALIFVTSLTVSLFFTFSGKDEKSDSPATTERDKLLELLNSITDNNELEEDGTPQNKALTWLVDDVMLHDNMTDDVILERYIVSAFYFSTGGEYWNDDLNFMQNISVCNWWKEDFGGVECNLNGEISSITAANNNLTGTLLSELLQLPSLAYLKLEENALIGTIPDIYMQSKSLRTLNLGHNSLTGSIPDFQEFLGYNEIHLVRNELTGNIPEFISRLSLLKILNFNSNNLNGTIPTDIGRMESLERIDLGHNNLSGTIPYQIRNLKDLTMLVIDNNYLSGTIPERLNNLENLNELNLHKNKLSGKIPSEIATMRKLFRLNLSFNRLTGTFPKDFASSKTLVDIHIEYNNLTGSLDEHFCSEESTAKEIYSDCLESDNLGSPSVQCSCCRECCVSGGPCQVMNNIKMCGKFDSTIQSLMKLVIKQVETCTCDEKNQLLTCSFSQENPCEVCNSRETTCFKINFVTFQFDERRRLDISIKATYSKGLDNSFVIGFKGENTYSDTYLSYCNLEIDGKECESCVISYCGSTSKRVPQIACEDNVFDGCNYDIDTDYGIFEFVTLFMNTNLVSEDSCNLPYIFDINDLFDTIIINV